MAIRVTGPMLDGISVRRTSSGLEVTESYLVQGLDGPPATRPLRALGAGGIPQHGQRYSGDASIQVDDAQVTLAENDPTKCTVSVTYRRPVVDGNDSSFSDEGAIDESDFGVLEVWTTTAEQETEVDVAGQQIVVEHTYTSGERAGQTVTQGGKVTVQLPVSGFRLTRVESRPPLGVAARYTGFINRNPWNGYGSRLVLCTGIEGRTSDGGLTYETTYTFAINLDQWKAGVIYHDPETGQVPPGIKKDIGYKRVHIYPAIDFSALNIDLRKSRRGPSRSIAFGLPEFFFPDLRT